MNSTRFWLGLLVGLIVGSLAGRWTTHMLHEPDVSVAEHSRDHEKLTTDSGATSTPAEMLSTSKRVIGQEAFGVENELGNAQPDIAESNNLAGVANEPAPIKPPSGQRLAEPSRAGSSRPIAVPDELKNILSDVPDIERSMSIKEAHRAISAQDKDDSWAYTLEQNIRQFFASHPQGATFDLWLVECRQSFCELQGANFSEDRESIVKQVMTELQQQPELASISQTWSSSSSSDGVLYFAYIMNWSERNPPTARE